MSDKKITIVTISFNVVKDIEKTILSVVDQTYDNIEYIVIDGGSTDGTVDIIKKYARGGSEADKHNHIISNWVSEPDRGIYDAMNKGISLATGKYINFMNAGDCLFNNKTIENIDYHGDIIYGDAVYVYPNFKLLYKPQALEKFEYNFPIYHQATFIRGELAKLFPFDCRYKSSADYDALRKLYFKNYKFVYIPKTICLFEAVSGLSTHTRQRLRETSSINGQINSKFYRVREELAVFKTWLKSKFKYFCPTLATAMWKRSLLKNDFIYEI